MTENQDFELRKMELPAEEGLGVARTLLEPTLPAALELQEDYMEIFVDQTAAERVQIRLKESEYMRAVLSTYCVPAIDIGNLPARVYPQVRAIMDQWEVFSGVGALQQVIQDRVQQGAGNDAEPSALNTGDEEESEE